MKLNKRQFILGIAVMAALGMVSSVTYAKPSVEVNHVTVVAPTAGTAVVDGNISEWNTSAGSPDFSAKMCTAGSIGADGNCEGNGKVQLSTMYSRYNCNTGTMYVLVLATAGHTPNPSASDAWVKIYDLGQSPQVDGNSSSFAWVYNGSTLAGYEASFTVAAGTYNDVQVHLQVDGNTSSTGKNGDTMELIIPECPDITADVDNFDLCSLAGPERETVMTYPWVPEVPVEVVLPSWSLPQTIEVPAWIETSPNTSVRVSSTNAETAATYTTGTNGRVDFTVTVQWPGVNIETYLDMLATQIYPPMEKWKETPWNTAVYPSNVDIASIFTGLDTSAMPDVTVSYSVTVEGVPTITKDIVWSPEMLRVVKQYHDKIVFNGCDVLAAENPKTAGYGSVRLAVNGQPGDVLLTLNTMPSLEELLAAYPMCEVTTADKAGYFLEGVDRSGNTTEFVGAVCH